MRSWVMDRIAEWVRWQSTSTKDRAILIPPEVQVGKILEAYNGSIDSAIAFVDGQLQRDSQLAAFRGSEYWHVTHRILMEYKTKCIIEGSYDDTHSDRVLGKPWFG